MYIRKLILQKTTYDPKTRASDVKGSADSWNSTIMKLLMATILVVLLMAYTTATEGKDYQ